MTKDFLAFVFDGCNEHFKTNTDVTPNAKWVGHINFDNIGWDGIIRKFSQPPIAR
jgi:hypothetical protein